MRIATETTRMRPIAPSAIRAPRRPSERMRPRMKKHTQQTQKSQPIFFPGGDAVGARARSRSDPHRAGRPARATTRLPENGRYGKVTPKNQDVTWFSGRNAPVKTEVFRLTPHLAGARAGYQFQTAFRRVSVISFRRFSGRESVCLLAQ